ncbi:hypothetical protein DPMN_077110 [Dreissena polymorpha]|uniref:Uncharacterized protein n=1 Tax=Dreissena polymorpha TaxID=45954 RepID=A0A9D4BP17_DREPO|nr:hypothetical protein DPMN_077110 [Dreissena polymorpha]
MDRYFNARHRSSNSVSVRKTLTIAPPNIVKRLIAARAKLKSSGCPAIKISALALRT